jgi:hypothetical protein
VQGHDNGYAVTIWLDKTNYLILRIDEELPARFGAVESTSYEPAIDEDVAVPPFDPPHRAGILLVAIGGGTTAVVVGGVGLLIRKRRRQRVGARVGAGPCESTRVPMKGAAQQADEADEA